MSKDGFSNEKRICSYLHNKTLERLNPNMKKLILFLFPKIKKSDIIKCNREGGIHKSDIIISVGELKKRISVKEGSGNSVHQEPLEEFIDFLEENFRISEKFKDDLRFFIWGDYTLNGSGDKKSRMSSYEIKKKFPKLVGRIREFMEAHKKQLIKRFVIMGAKSDKKPDLIYYGDVNLGYWAESKDALELLSSHKSKSAIPVGKLTFQAWNRAIKKDNHSEHKRGVIQLKWPTIKPDLKSLMKK